MGGQCESDGFGKDEQYRMRGGGGTHCALLPLVPQEVQAWGRRRQ